MDTGCIIFDSCCLDFLVFVQRHQSGKPDQVSFGDFLSIVGLFYIGFPTWVLVACLAMDTTY